MSSDQDGDGWLAFTPPGGADGLHVHWRRDDAGRWVADGLYLHGPALTPAMLREISLPRLEARINAQRSGSQRSAGNDEDLTISTLRRRSSELADVAAMMEAHVASNRKALGMPPRIGRPDGSDPESFYRQVATSYRHYAEQTRAPATIIAEEAGVPVTTVHRWIREARQRGFLPQGRRGKAG